jgi:putative membrane protein
LAADIIDFLRKTDLCGEDQKCGIGATRRIHSISNRRIIMKSPHLFTAAVCGLSFAVMQSTAALAVSSEDFVQKASIANEFEIESSKIALDKSQNADVKRFAQKIIKDHTKTASDMDEAVRASKLEVTPPTTLDEKHQKMLDKLQNVPASKFNRDYISMQQAAHKEAISLFKDYSKNGNNASLKDFASQTLPDLEDHLKEAKKINEKG